MTIATPVAPATTEPTTPMKLSEAIRLGSLLTEPTTGEYLVYRELQEVVHVFACALGAAAYVHGVRRGKQAFVWAHEQGWAGIEAVCPDCNIASGDYREYGIVQHLNDRHRWDRPRIADWLEGIGL